jgi:hypothetical protein
MLSQCDLKQKTLTIELAEKIADIGKNGTKNGWLIDIDTIHTEYTKKFKEIEIIIFCLKNKFNDETLENLCCLQQTKIEKDKQSVKQDKDKIEKKEKISKYIAIYSN